MSDWKEVIIGNHIDLISGYAFKSADFMTEKIDGLLPVIKIKNVANGDVNLKDVVYHRYNSSLYNFQLSKGDILIAMTGNHPQAETQVVGDVSRYKLEENALLNQRVGKLIVKDGTNLEFIYYLFKNDDVRYHLANLSSGSANQANISKSNILGLNLIIPSPTEQVAIASVLSSLDDKIDLLHRQNKTLEAMAETLFRQWFVEEADEKWEEKPIGNLFDISSGKGLRREQFNDNGIYPVLGANGMIGRTDSFLYDEKLIFTGRVGTLGNLFIVDNKKVWLSDNTLVIRPKEYFYSTYFILKSSKLEEYNVGSTQPLIRQSDVKEIELALPQNETLEKFEAESEALFLKIKINQSQIRTLEKLRDTLLPKLISGEVRVICQTGQTSRMSQTFEKGRTLEEKESQSE